MIKRDFLSVHVRGHKKQPHVLYGYLSGNVEVDACAWTLGDGQLVINLEKETDHPCWPKLLKEPAELLGGLARTGGRFISFEPRAGRGHFYSCLGVARRGHKARGEGREAQRYTSIVIQFVSSDDGATVLHAVEQASRRWRGGHAPATRLVPRRDGVGARRTPSTRSQNNRAVIEALWQHHTLAAPARAPRGQYLL